MGRSINESAPRACEPNHTAGRNFAGSIGAVRTVHAADLEAEMLIRGMILEVIDWSEDQARLSFE
jgi:hypothetical protein